MSDKNWLNLILWFISISDRLNVASSELLYPVLMLANFDAGTPLFAT